MSEIQPHFNKNYLTVHPPGTMSHVNLRKLKNIKKLKNKKYKKITKNIKHKNSLNSSGWKLRLIFLLLTSDKNPTTGNKLTLDPGWFQDDTETSSAQKETAVSVYSYHLILNSRDTNLSIHPLGTKSNIILKNHKNTKKLKNNKNTKKSIKHKNNNKITINFQTKKPVNSKKSIKNKNNKKITICNHNLSIHPPGRMSHIQNIKTQNLKKKQ